METNNATTIQSYYVAERDVLALYADFSPVLQDLELHVLSNSLGYDDLTKQLLADGLSALGLYVSSRPLDEHVGWTISIQEPRMNLFFAGSPGTEAVMGRAFTNEEEVQVRESNLFVCQSQRERHDTRESFVDVEGIDIFAMAERYYSQSEQKIARFFHRAGKVALLEGLPDVDEPWLRALDEEEVFQLPEREGVRFLAARSLAFRCGCDERKIGTRLVAACGSVAELFGEESRLTVECPRCGSHLVLSRESFEKIEVD